MRQGLGKPIFLVEKCEGLWYNANAFYGAGLACVCNTLLGACKNKIKKTKNI